MDKLPPCAKKLWNKTLFPVWELLTKIPVGLVQPFASYIIWGDQISVDSSCSLQVFKKSIVKSLTPESHLVISPDSIFRSEQRLGSGFAKGVMGFTKTVEFFPLN